MRARARGEPSRVPLARAQPRAQLVLSVDGAIVTGHRIPVLRLIAQGDDRRAPELANLGPDLLGPNVDDEEALRRLRALSSRAIGDALLVQRAMAGIGNVFKSEVLFLERIDPRTPLAKIDDVRLRAVIRRARELLAANLGRGPRTTRRAPGSRVWVYGRGGEPCLVCGAPIVRLLQGAPPGRSTYACPACQR
jgi:endonuclease-8